MRMMAPPCQARPVCWCVPPATRRIALSTCAAGAWRAAAVAMAVLARGHRLSAETLLALTVTALIAFTIAIGAELITIRLRGAEVSTSLLGAIELTWRDGAPLDRRAGCIQCRGRRRRLSLRCDWHCSCRCCRGGIRARLGLLLRLAHLSGRWNTVAVLAVGALLSLVRIADLAQAVAGPGLVALGTLVLLLAAIEAAGLRHLWLEPDPVRPATALAPSRPGAHCRGCECCGWTGFGPLDGGAPPRCPRCANPLEHARGPACNAPGPSCWRRRCCCCRPT